MARSHAGGGGGGGGSGACSPENVLKKIVQFGTF